MFQICPDWSLNRCWTACTTRYRRCCARWSRRRPWSTTWTPSFSSSMKSAMRGKRLILIFMKETPNFVFLDVFQISVRKAALIPSLLFSNLVKQPWFVLFFSVVMETDVQAVVSRCALRGDEISLTDQSFSQVFFFRNLNFNSFQSIFNWRIYNLQSFRKKPKDSEIYKFVHFYSETFLLSRLFQFSGRDVVLHLCPGARQVVSSQIIPFLFYLLFHSSPSHVISLFLT